MNSGINPYPMRSSGITWSIMSDGLPSAFELTSAESMPFPDASFDRVTSRQSAHHYASVPAALREVGRVLKPDGLFVLIDTFAPEDEELDSFLNAIELLRDSSHIRDYRVSEWAEMFAEVGFVLTDTEAWDIPLEFDDWVTRSRTPDEDVAALRSRFAKASDQVRARFHVDDDCNWSVPIGLVVGRRA